MIRLCGSVKFFCAFGSGSGEGGAAGGPGFLRPSAWRFASASAAAFAFASQAALASASSSACAARILAARRFLSATQAGSSSCRRHASSMTRLSFPCSLSSAASVASAAANHFSTSASSSLARASIRPYDIALCLEALALIFEPSNATCPSFTSPAGSGKRC